MFTGLLDEFGPSKDGAITAVIANRLYDAEGGSPDWEVKWHVIDLLNYCEYVAVCIRCHVGDHMILANAVNKTLARWHRELSAFMRVTEERRGLQPVGAVFRLRPSVGGRERVGAVSGPFEPRGVPEFRSTTPRRSPEPPPHVGPIRPGRILPSCMASPFI
jgi:hypothetical protein